MIPTVLYHGSQTDAIQTLEPRRRYTPGTEKDPPAGVYASDDPAFAAAHSFPWSSNEGVDLYFDRAEDDASECVVLEVPQEIVSRLDIPVHVYSVCSETFSLLDIPPQGHNYRSIAKVNCLAKSSFNTVKEAILHYRGKVIIKETCTALVLYESADTVLKRSLEHWRKYYEVVL